MPQFKRRKNMFQRKLIRMKEEMEDYEKYQKKAQQLKDKWKAAPPREIMESPDFIQPNPANLGLSLAGGGGHPRGKGGGQRGGATERIELSSKAQAHLDERLAAYKAAAAEGTRPRASEEDIEAAKAAATPEKKTTGSWSRVLRSQPRPISPASSPPDVAMPPSTIAACPLIAVCMNVPNSPGMSVQGRSARVRPRPLGRAQRPTPTRAPLS